MKKLFLLLATLSIFWTASAQQPATYINGTPPPFIFTGGGVSQNGQTFTFSNGGGGSVTSFSAGTLSPLFTTSVATPTATPALSFTLSNAAQNSIFAGPPSGGAAAPSFQTAPTFALTNATGLPAAQLLSGALGNGMTATTQSQLDGSTKLATNAYVDLAVSNAVAGVNPAVAVLAASTANIAGTYTQVGGGVGDFFTVTATGTFSLDGIAINTIGQRVLLKDQSTASQNGVYFATVVGAVAVSPVFTRALDYDTPSDVNNTGAIPVQSGTANTTTSWLLTSQVVSIGSAGSSLTYAKFSIAPSTLVTASSPGVGVAHFAGSTQAVTSSAVTPSDATGNTSGSGNFALVTSPTFTTPALGTPSALVLTNATGLNGHITAVSLTCADSSGSGTAQVCTTSPSYTPAANDEITYTTTTTNSGTGLTVNVNSLGAKSVAIPGASGWTTTLTANIIPANKPLTLKYDGTNLNVQQTGTTSAATTGAWTNITGSVTVAGCAVSSGACVVSGTTTNVVTFSVIPGTYNQIQYVGNGLGSSAGSIRVTYNGDSTAAHYSFNGYFQASNGGVSGDFATSTGFCPFMGLTTTGVDQGMAYIVNYANTSFSKFATDQGGNMASPTTGTNNGDARHSCGWDDGSHSAITSITFTATAGHLIAGTEFMILGQN